MKEINVIGTMQLLAACQKAESFAKLVVQSSVSVYGASPRDPAKFTEDLSPGCSRAPGSARTRSRSSPTSAGWPGAGPTWSSPPCGWPT